MKEMNLLIFWGILLRNMKVIMVVAAVAAFLAGGATELLTEDSYSSRCTMYVMNITEAGEITGISSAGLDASQRMVKEYIEILKSNTVIEDVQARLLQKNYKMSVTQIRASLSMAAVSETALLKITATTGNPDLSKDICDAIQECAPDHVKSVMQGIGHVATVDVAARGSLRSPDTARNTVLGAMIGFVVSCGFAVAMYMMDNTIKDERDLKSRYEVNVLGAVPSFSVSGSSRSKKKKKKTDKNATAENAETEKKGEN